MISEQCNQIFEQVVYDYHKHNDINRVQNNPFAINTFENLLYSKCWIDTVQWHMEDEIRSPNLPPPEIVQWKRKIDRSNQERTDIVELIDDYFISKFKNVEPKKSARCNTESPAWAIDRLSILILKIFHMREETVRVNISEPQSNSNREKLSVLLQQQRDLSLSIDELLEDIEKGDKYMKVYRQMKMYNDPELNPVLYNKK